MSHSCPLPTPEQARYLAIQFAAERAMLDAIGEAIDRAASRAAEGLASTGIEGPDPSRGYLLSVAHQALFCMLCGADPDSFAGGDAAMAERVLRNGKNIADHYG